MTQATKKPLRSRIQDVVAALVGRPAFWAVVLGLAFLLPLGRALGKSTPKGPALRMPLPAFQLTDERRQPFSLETLRGKVWVADFIFTSCPTACPKLTKRMFELQHRTRNLGDAFHLVSFTVDPENDTPERLAAYAASVNARPNRWSFVTGPLGTIETTVVHGFKLAMGKEDNGDGIFTIFHGERLVLVDREGAIRGYYEANDEGMDQLVRDVGVLVNVP
jgi:protein SCO1/2